MSRRAFRPTATTRLDGGHSAAPGATNGHPHGDTDAGADRYPDSSAADRYPHAAAGNGNTHPKAKAAQAQGHADGDDCAAGQQACRSGQNRQAKAAQAPPRSACHCQAGRRRHLGPTTVGGNALAARRLGRARSIPCRRLEPPC